MLIVGLTGGIASGKSTISRYLQELGAVIIDADIIAREVVEPGKTAWQEIRKHFGQQVITTDQTLDRKKLANIIFNNPQERIVLNKIIHPQVIKETQKQIKQYKERKDIPLLVVDAPLLIEAGMTNLVDEVWVIDVDEETQIQRIRKRDQATRVQAENRIKSQMATAKKLEYANRIIDNKGSLKDTLKQIRIIWEQVADNQH